MTAIYGIVVQVHGPRLRGLLGGLKPPNPDYVEILTRLGEAIQGDPRFHDLGWFTKEEFLSRQVGALTPLGAYDSSPCMRYFGPVGDDEPYVPPPPAPFAPDAALVARGWADLAPHPVRRWVARIFDFWVTTGLVFAVLAILLVVVDRQMETLGALVGLLAVVFLLSPVRGLVAAMLNALLLSRFSTTPGKWLCGVRIVSKDGNPLTYRAAFGREFAVFTAGCGLYLPLIALVVVGYNFFQLRKIGVTKWDEDRNLVAVHRPDSFKQAVLIVLALIPVAVIIMVLAAIGDALEAQRLAGGGQG